MKKKTRKPDKKHTYTKKENGLNDTGAPLKFETDAILQKKIDNYFSKCEKRKKPLTITGLALALDTSRKVLIEYEAKDEFSNTIKKAKLMCENFADEFLFGGKQVAGAIFNLKNNYGWSDKIEVGVNPGYFQDQSKKYE